jgi:hypothetical protein
MTDIVDEIRARISKMSHSRLNDAYLMDRAAQEIERLRDVCDDLYSDLLAAGSLTPQDCGAYALIQETIRLRRDRWARKQTPNNGIQSKDKEF